MIPYIRTWSDVTRLAHLNRNVLGFNTDKKRLEFYSKDLDKWFYLYGLEEIISYPVYLYLHLIEDFETGWVDLTRQFNSVFNESFETW